MLFIFAKSTTPDWSKEIPRWFAAKATDTNTHPSLDTHEQVQSKILLCKLASSETAFMAAAAVPGSLEHGLLDMYKAGVMVVTNHPSTRT
jgi:hypothetical protein